MTAVPQPPLIPPRHWRPAGPTAREWTALAVSVALWLVVTALGVGMRPEHFMLAGLVVALFVATPSTRRLVVALLPFVAFGVSYDWMNLVPNYRVNPVDIAGIYHAEHALFGIGALTPNEWAALHRAPALDVLAGVFYLCWVPVPVIYGLWLYFAGQRRAYLHFALAFLLVNLLGFAGYYVHPAAPPWYVAEHGFQFATGTGGSVAGLAGFGDITGWKVFEGLYARNSNVFAAVPSLHSAYTLVAFIYSLRSRTPLWTRVALGVITVGIWLTAVYTSHHYVIDVLLGIATALAGVALLEMALMHWRPFRQWVAAYVRYISPPRSKVRD